MYKNIVGDPAFAVRFWGKTKSDANGCILWLGAKDTTGYGIVKIQRKERGAHRVAWELRYGKIGPGLCILHRCDTPPCVNTAHLRLGTKLENYRDCQEKGRNKKARGERHGRSKLTTKTVLEIRRLCDAGVALCAMADRFHVTPSAISAVVTRKTWRHL